MRTGGAEDITPSLREKAGSSAINMGEVVSVSLHSDTRTKNQEHKNQGPLMLWEGEDECHSQWQERGRQREKKERKIERLHIFILFRSSVVYMLNISHRPLC
jgi:hypothetical protein